MKIALKRAATTGEVQQLSLARGLNVRVRGAPERLCLWRDTGEWQGDKRAETEGHVCAKVLGWTEHTVTWSGKYLIVEPTQALL
ncbi:hypothetical protein DM785_02485 [Deinococcus actinosclerus]|nr:hypothetical protein DM785_02485 [Deinococcus actinosclerus]